MTALLITAASLLYASANLFVARHIYGTWRARALDKRIKDRSYRRDDDQTALADAREWFRSADRPFYMLGAGVVAVLWPVALLCMAASRWMDSTPVRANAELKVEQASMRTRIKQLEQELGLR